MKRFTVIAISIVLAGLLLLSYRSADVTGQQLTLATVDHEVIPAEEFRMRYIDFILATGLKDEFQYRSHFLNTLIAERLLILEAKEQGIESSADV